MKIINSLFIIINALFLIIILPTNLEARDDQIELPERVVLFYSDGSAREIKIHEDNVKKVSNGWLVTSPKENSSSNTLVSNPSNGTKAPGSGAGLTIGFYYDSIGHAHSGM